MYLVIFGEIAPQSVCVRYGLPIGSWMAPFVLVLMYILSPVAWPTAKLLDWLLGEDHGTVYKKSGLKTLVSLHKSLGDTGQKLNEDEVTIIGAVLDLKDKSVGSIMTPMEDVYTMSLDDVLDEETMDEVLSQGYSRIPVHHPDNDRNFVGMLLVKMLITYDPEDAMPVRDFALATLPETAPDTSCLDIINFFQEGKSHMILVSEFPGQDHGALGVLTLEDVIEELIGEEIVDESDVFVDVHKAIRRLAPSPAYRTRLPKGHMGQVERQAANGHESDLIDIHEGETLSPVGIQRVKTMDGVVSKTKSSDRNASPRQGTFPMRRRSSATDHKPQRYSSDEVREHLKHLGPSNLASRPKATRSTTVKIKPGNAARGSTASQGPDDGYGTSPRKISESAGDYQGGLGEGLVASAGKEASDGVQALQQGHGGYNRSPAKSRPSNSASKGVQADPADLIDVSDEEYDVFENGSRRGRGLSQSTYDRERNSRSTSTVRSLPKKENRSESSLQAHRGPARSGSITENIIDVNGIRKVVLQTNSSSSNDEDENSGANKGRPDRQSLSRSNSTRLRGSDDYHNIDDGHNEAAKKKKRRRRKHGNGKGEQEPLIGGHR
jgi:metal transporter CNNM